jgi:hypothetical protein
MCKSDVIRLYTKKYAYISIRKSIGVHGSNS